MTKVLNLKTWFTCCNCEDRFYVAHGCYTFDNKNFFCEECMHSLNKEMNAQDELEFLRTD